MSEREATRVETHRRALKSSLWLAVVAAQEVGDGALVDALGQLHAQAVALHEECRREEPGRAC